MSANPLPCCGELAPHHNVSHPSHGGTVAGVAHSCGNPIHCSTCLAEAAAKATAQRTARRKARR